MLNQYQGIIHTAKPYLDGLTHWGRVTHICVSKLAIIGSDNGLSPSATIHYQNQWWNNVNWTTRNKLQWNFNGNSYTVREITKSSSTFSATNISSNIVWLLQLHDTIQTKSYFGTKFSSIYFAKWEKRLVFRLSFVNLQHAKDSTHMFDAKYRYSRTPL